LGAICQRADPNAFDDSEGGRMSITLAKSKRHCPVVAAFAVGNEYGGRQLGYAGLRVVPPRPGTAGRNTLPGMLLPEVRSYTPPAALGR
jgi:hypothetical protein